MSKVARSVVGGVALGEWIKNGPHDGVVSFDGVLVIRTPCSKLASQRQN